MSPEEAVALELAELRITAVQPSQGRLRNDCLGGCVDAGDALYCSVRRVCQCGDKGPPTGKGQLSFCSTGLEGPIVLMGVEEENQADAGNVIWTGGKTGWGPGGARLYQENWEAVECKKC